MYLIVAVVYLIINGTHETKRYDAGFTFDTMGACEEYRASDDNAASVSDLVDYLFSGDDPKLEGLTSAGIETQCEADG